jgi:PRA1 family protein 1
MGYEFNKLMNELSTNLLYDIAPEPMQVGEHVVTQKSLYTGLFVIGIPLLWFASPISLIFWLVGASSVIILLHACIIEPGVESEYGNVQEAV